MRVAVFVCMVACGSSTGKPLPPQPSPSSPSSIRPSPPPISRPAAQALEAGRAIDREIDATEIHRYRVKLAANSVITGVVDQDGIDLEVVTYDATGAKLRTVDSPNGEHGPEPFVIEGTTAGDYDFEVRQVELPPDAPPGTLTSSHGKYHATIQVMSANDYAYQVASQRIASPTILALWREVSLHHADAVDKFWAGLSGKSPIVEPYPNHPDESLVTFVFRSNQPYVGAFVPTKDQEEPLVKIGDSDLWYVSIRVPTDSRFDYAFIAADGPPDLLEKPENPDKRFLEMQRDPNNPVMHGGKSRVELPAATPQLWIDQKPDVPKGKLEDIAISSTRLKEKRKVLIYLPPAYDPTKHYPLLVAFDAEKYGMEPRNTEIPLPTILDNLIAAHKIPPIVAALVASESFDKRMHDLACSDPFSHFVVDELIPKMRADFHAGLKPTDVTLTGSSLGGLTSSFIAFHHPDVIGNVLSQSGSYWWIPGWPERDFPRTTEGNVLAREIAVVSRKPINFYLEAGIFEHNLLDSNRHLRDVLVAKGYRVTYREFHGGHDYLMWRGSISEGLIALFARR